MRVKSLAFAAAVTGMVLGPLDVRADDDVKQQLEAMSTRLEQLENRLLATQDQLEEANDQVAQQQQVIERAGLTDSQSGLSGLAAFLEDLEIGGWVAGSYFYNFNEPDNSFTAGANTGFGGIANPFRPDHNAFRLDQLWFELGKPATTESRAGFYAELGFGDTAGLLPSGNTGGFSNDLYVLGYVEYLTPWDVTLKMGKFGTYIGAEVVQTPYNLNITRGLLYNLFQPIDHTGIAAEGSYDSGFEWKLAAVNGFSVDDPDPNNSKSFLWSVGWSNEQFGASFNGIYGAEVPGDAGPKTAVYDVVLSFDPIEDFTAWLNFDYLDVEEVLAGGPIPMLEDAQAWGIAAAGRYALTERVGAALRFEYIDDSDGFFLAADDGQLYSVTGTVDWTLTDHLLVRGEVQYITAERDDEIVLPGFPTGDDFFIGSDTIGGMPEFDEDSQILAGVEVIYMF